MTTAQKTKKACKFMAGVVGLKLLLALSGCGDGTTTDPNGNGPPLTQAEREAKARQQIMAHPNYCMTNHNHAQVLQEVHGHVPGTFSFIDQLMQRKLACFFLKLETAQPYMNVEVSGNMVGSACSTSLEPFSFGQVNVREVSDRSAQMQNWGVMTTTQTTPNVVRTFEASRLEPNFQGF